MKNIVFLDAETIPEHIPFPPFSFTHTYTGYPFTENSQVVERAREAEIIISNKVRLDAAILNQLPKLEMIAVAATGVDNIDLETCAKQKVAVANVRGYATTTVPEHVFAMAFALRRNLLSYHNDVMAGAWAAGRQFCFLTHRIGDMAGATLGIFGKGSLGTAVGKLAQALGMQVLYGEHKEAKSVREGYVAFEEVLKKADIVTLHCPLTPRTKLMIGEKELALMKKDAILINAGRGGLVDEKALAAALLARSLGGAGVDVLSKEPPAEGNVLLNPAIPNLLITPHIAWGSDSAITTLVAQVVENINLFVAGTPIRLLA